MLKEQLKQKILIEAYSYADLKAKNDKERKDLFYSVIREGIEHAKKMN